MRADEKNYSIYALIAGSRGYVVYTTDAARAVYRRHYMGKCAETVDLFSGETRVAMYQLEELHCTQQQARIRRGVWLLWLHKLGFVLVSESAQDLLKKPDRRDQIAVNCITLRPSDAFCEKNNLAEKWGFKESKRILSFSVSVAEYANACHQAADVGLSLSEYIRERYCAAMPSRQSISELYSCLQCAESTGRMADAAVKQGILLRTVDPEAYAQLTAEVASLREATAQLSEAISRMIKKEN